MVSQLSLLLSTCFLNSLTGITNDHGYVPLVVNTSQSFPHSWIITGFVTRLTRQVPLVEQELLTLLEHLSLPPVFSGVCVIRSLVLCVCFVDRCLSFVLFLLTIVLSVLRFTDSDYPFGIFKLFLNLSHFCDFPKARIWISNIICCDPFFCVQSVRRVIVRLVDHSSIVDHD